MKKVITCIISILTAFNCISQNCVQIDESSSRLNEFYDIYNYNTSQKVDSVIIYDYKYSKKGKIKDSTEIARTALKLKSYDQDNYVVTYDSSNREFQRFKITDGVKALNAEKQYNSEGKLILWIWFTREGKVHSKTVYEYDSQGNLVLTNKYTGYWYLERPKLERRTEYKYFNNKIIETIEYYDQKSDSSWFEICTTKFDNLSRKTYYKDDGGEYYWSCTYIYNSHGLLTKEIIEGNAREKSIKEYSYFDSGLPSQLYWSYTERKKNNNICLIRYYYK